MVQRIFTYQNLKFLGSCVLLMFPIGLVVHGQTSFTVKGKITDTKGVTMPGVSVTIKHSPRGVVSDNAGDYVISLPKGRDTLVFSFLGFVKQQIVPGDRHTINVVLLDDKNDLNEVAVVAYGTQKKESMVSSITTISPKEIKGPTSNLTTMLAGRISGLISYQRSGSRAMIMPRSLSGESPLLVPVKSIR
ncbi:carboxypeptidase-like regulatory domain-containing protein [Mucilaginibacter sp. P25]|uniref:carboxypeptidase-like regulatory domain-containing protein n=1 Tax=unclassified Mucilaginibacter TaxID=2617802 RepID=UPI003D67B0D2